jgi:hypothetical protein
MITYVGHVGWDLLDCAKEMVKLAREHNDFVVADINAYRWVALEDSDPQALVDGYFTDMERKHVEYLESPEYLEDQKRSQEYERIAIEAKAKGILPFHVLSIKEKRWDELIEINSHDEYSACTVRYAARWANMMEQEFTLRNVPLAEVAEKTTHTADLEGITGFMFGCAVSMLSEVWIWGDALRVWHNSNYGVGAEAQGVVNPAIMYISKE